jgi:hypothetical protein
MMGQATDQQVIEQLTERAAAGDGIMLMLAPSSTAQFGTEDLFAAWADIYGITAQTDRVVLREMRMPDRDPVAVPTFQVARWPAALPVTEAVQGLDGIFIQPVPLTLDSAADGESAGAGEAEADADDEPVSRTWPLVELTDTNMWASTNWQVQSPEYDPNTSGERFLVAAAAERGETRVVVIGDALWARDLVTTNADPRLAPQGVGLAQLFGAAYPANAELFVNCVFWLADLDQLIAAGARTQDIPRIGAISRGGMTALRWVLLAGLPAAALGAGVAVWLARRGG